VPTERCYDGRVRRLLLAFTLLPIVDLWLLLTTVMATVGQKRTSA